MPIITLDVFDVNSSSSTTVAAGMPTKCSGAPSNDGQYSSKQVEMLHRFLQAMQRMSRGTIWFVKRVAVPRNQASSSILRRARMLSVLSFVLMFVYIACALATPQFLYPFFMTASICIFINIIVGVYFELYLSTSIIFIGIQMMLCMTTGVHYYANISVDQQTTLTLFQHFYVANMMSALVSTGILFPNYLMAALILFILALSNTVACAYLRYGLGMPEMVFQNIIITAAAAILLLFHSYIITLDLSESAEKEQRVRCLFNISSDALIVHKNGIILDANETFEEIFQVKIKSILYKVPSTISEFLPDFEKLMEYSRSFETFGINSLGESFAVVVKVEKVRHYNEDIDIISVIDISAKKKLIEADLALRKAEAVNEAKINFLTTVSHEVRTPINGILASVEIVENTQLDETQRDFLSCIKDSSCYLLDLITDILDFSKIEAGKMELQKVEFNMITMLEEAMNIVYTTAQERDLEILLNVEESVPIVVIGDPYRVKQVLLNFLSNAIKFTPKGYVIVRVKLIKVTAHQVSPMTEYTVCFEVEDSGIGIKEEQMDSLFTAFLQLDGTSQRKHQGTGLGLSISKRLCQLMGGEISVKSKYDNGSTFSFTSMLQSKQCWTFGSIGSSLALYNSNLSMVSTNNDQFICQPISGYVYDSNQHVRHSAIHYFSLLKVNIKPLTEEKDLIKLIGSGGELESKNRQDIILIITSELSTSMMEEISNSKSKQLPLIYWILIKDGQPNLIENQFYASSLRKPLQLQNVAECLYSIQRVPIPADLNYLLTNSRTTRTSLELHSSGKDKRKPLQHHRNSSYSDHVAITRGLVQNNRSPRPTDAQYVISTSPNTNGIPDTLMMHFETKYSPEVLLNSPVSASPIGRSIRTGSLSMSASPISDQTQFAADRDDQAGNDESIPANEIITMTTPPKSNPATPPKKALSSVPSTPSPPISSGIASAMGIKSSGETYDPLRKSSSMYDGVKSPTLALRLSPNFQSVAENFNPCRRLSIPLLDLDSQKEEFSRKSRSSLGSIEIFSPTSPTNANTPTNQFAVSTSSSAHIHNLGNVSHLSLAGTNGCSSNGGAEGGIIASSSSANGKLPKSSFKILLVEDNKTNVKVFLKFLKDGGYTVDVAWNGMQGVEVSKSTYYPIIFMDCMMPLLDGYQATAAIRKREREIMAHDKRYKKSFVVALTANVTPSDQAKCYEVGMDDFLHKPLRGSTVLFNIIDKYLKNFTEEDLQYLSSLNSHQSSQSTNTTTTITSA